MEHKVSYVKILGFIFLFAGIGLMVTSLVYGPTINTITGIIIFLLSLGYLINPALVYDENEIRMKNIWGKTTKVHSLDDVQLFEGELYAKGRRIRLYRTILVQSEFQELVDHICDRAERIKRRSVHGNHNHERPGLYHNDLLRAMWSIDPEKIRQN